MSGSRKIKARPQKRVVVQKAARREGKRRSSGRAMQIGEGLVSAVGSYLLPGAGSAIGGAIGKGLGWGFSKITGMGDYKISANTLVRASPVPIFGENGIRIKHKEYLGDISGTTGFSLASYPINPGLPGTFPWLATVASGFEEYAIVGLMFSFVSTSADALNSTNTALGKIIMATDYDSAHANFSSTPAMLATEFCNYGKPALDLLHAIECDPAQRPTLWQYVRTTSPPSGTDIRLYDLGNFQIASQGMQAAANIGGLWVSYDVILTKPVLAASSTSYDQWTQLLVAPAANPIFTGANQSVRTVGGTLAGNVYSFPAAVNSGVYRVEVVATSVAGATTMAGSLSALVNCAGTNKYNGYANGNVRSTFGNASTSDFTTFVDVSITAPAATFTVTAANAASTATHTLRVTYLGPS